ncbi:MAG: MetS family NSS transporter small subunit [Lactovum sp.]
MNGLSILFMLFGLLVTWGGLIFVIFIEKFTKKKP